MTPPIRVAMFIHRYYPFIGGAERQLQSLIPFLRERNVEVHVFTRRDPGLKAFELVEGVPVYRLHAGGSKPLAAASYIVTALRTLSGVRPAVLHAHDMLSPTTTAIVAKWLFRRPVVVTAHRSGTIGDVQRMQRKALGKQRLSLIRRNADRFVLISQEIGDELASVGVPRARCITIPNAIDTQRFAPQSAEHRRSLRESLRFPDAPVAVFAGRLAPEKRIDRLIHVWRVIRACHPGALLVVLGRGDEEERLKEMAEDGVRFEGGVDDVAPYFKAADLFVLPSVAEGLSVALLEAMSSGLVPIVTDVGGARDVIKHGEHGWLIPPEDDAALQSALLHLVANPALRTDMARQGRERILQNYTLPIAAARLHALYSELVNVRSEDRSSTS